MKNAACISLLCLVFAGCHKGEDDPFFSLNTRKSRLAGTWVMQSFTEETPALSRAYDGTTMTYTMPDSTTASRTFSWEMDFEREGAYTITTVEDFPEDTAAKILAYTTTVTERGEWEFTGGNNSPSKSRLLLMATYRETKRSDQGALIAPEDTDNPVTGRVYHINRLSADELVLTYDETVSTAFGQAKTTGEAKLTKKGK